MGLEAPSKAAAAETPMQRAHRNRLLRDIAEMQQKPYPRIRLVPIDLTRACVVLTPENYPPLHLTVLFGADYPLKAPTITIQSRINHPNVFGDYICASILNTAEGYTPAYTLKGICIQMLSFFNSDAVEQIYRGTRVSLDSYQRTPQGCGSDGCPKCSQLKVVPTYKCKFCSPSESESAQSGGTAQNKTASGSGGANGSAEEDKNSVASISQKASENGARQRAVLEASIDSLPDEILLETPGPGCARSCRATT
ncbi:hypothetical protein NLG97_g7049 [Lecanicillium saksenae]|uniref:Uncharacterized protein n=1 Tax=Lecanicillium saksenae TaxID=468837 RepID=A0ACC1QN16_9HYPO|nr:hypothetical protein NLG97_g7049 [Lecanicillium saksenae]